MYTNPVYQGTKSLAAQAASYDDALTKSQELKKIRDEKLSKLGTFTAENKQKLERILPDNVDNIRLIIDINNIAARHNLTLKNVALGTLSDSASKRSSAAVGASGDPVGSVDVSFGVEASYDTMLAFLMDIEHSLRVVDVEMLSFRASALGTDKNDYNFTIRTYWLH